MKKKITFIPFLLFLIVQSVFGQQAFLVYFKTSDYDTINSTLKVDVKVKDYIDVYSAQMYMTWDSSIYYFDSLSNINSELKNFKFNTKIQYAEDNNLATIWYDTETSSLPDDTTIFTVTLKVTGAPCDSTTLKLINLPAFRQSLTVYAKDGEYIEESIRYNEFLMSIPGENCNTTTNVKNDYLDLPDYIVYPNPVADEVNIDLLNNIPGEYNIIFYNILGKEIYREKITKQPGQYIYHHKINNDLREKLLLIEIIDPLKNKNLLKAIISN